MIIRKILFAYTVLIAATVFGLGEARATVLYEALPAGTHNTGAVSGGGVITAFDDFSLSDAATVTTVRWLGRFSNPTDQFAVGFYESDSQTDPFKAPLASPFFEVTSTAVETANPLDPIGLSRNYELDLGTGALLDPDTFYFISIKNLSTSFWQWQNDPGGLATIRLGDGSHQLFNGTLFFTLEGELAAGEPPIALAGPPAAAILALGLLGISNVRRLRNRARRKQSLRVKG